MLFRSRFSENPDNFSKEQWNLLGEVKKKLGSQAVEIRDILQKLPPVGAPAEQASQESKPAVRKAKKGKKKGGKKSQMRA